MTFFVAKWYKVFGKNLFRAAGRYEDMRTGPHHVFRIVRGEIRILFNTAFLFSYELENIVMKQLEINFCFNDGKSQFKKKIKEFLYADFQLYLAIFYIMQKYIISFKYFPCMKRIL